MSKAIVISALVALTQARFAQEQIPVSAVQALSDFGQPGAAGTLSGRVPGVLLAGANACDKLVLADDIIDQLGDDPQVIAAAQGVVAAEKNFNPFAQSIPTICSDASLPKNAALQGIVPLVDPAVLGSDVENKNSADTLANPAGAGGLSVADLAIQLGFSNFTKQDSAGGTEDVSGGAAAAAGGQQEDESADEVAIDCASAQADAGDNADQGADQQAAGNEAGNENANANANAGVQKSSIAGLDFGKCVPTMSFEFGRKNRKADEGTFLPTDPLVIGGQQDALNPNIITNEICDQLTNVCEANQAAKDACDKAQSLVQSLGTKDATTADAFNKALGF